MYKKVHAGVNVEFYVVLSRQDETFAFKVEKIPFCLSLYKSGMFLLITDFGHMLLLFTDDNVSVGVITELIQDFQQLKETVGQQGQN